MHARVVNVRAKDARWDIYGGRGRCPCGPRCAHPAGRYGNPFDVATYGEDAMRFFLAWLAGERDGPGVKAFQGPVLVEDVRIETRGKVWACWCAPRMCHCDVYARLADGEDLAAIRADVLARLAPQGELFGDAAAPVRVRGGDDA